jgi:hypothetical protein
MNFERHSCFRRLSASSRSIAFGLMMLLLALRAFSAFDLPASAFTNAGSEQGFVVAFDGDCSSGTAEDGSSPARHRHSPNCVYCLVSACSGLALAVSVSVGVAFDSISRENVSLRPPSDLVANSEPCGWTSSWSSQAPPSFS